MVQHYIQRYTFFCSRTAASVVELLTADVCLQNHFETFAEGFELKVQIVPVHYE